MYDGIRVVRGPDWKWDDQDGGEGHVGTVMKPNGHRAVVYNDTVFVRWDDGRIANYRIAESHDLRILSSACSVVHPGSWCGVCGTQSESLLGTMWLCSICCNFVLCDDCYHGDQHDITHPFCRQDFQSTTPSGQLVPARKDSAKVERMGIYPGAMVARNVENRMPAESDGGDDACLGTVLAESEDESCSESDKEDQTETEAPITTKPLEYISLETSSETATTTTAAAAATTALTIRRRRKNVPGHIRILWNSDDITTHRLGGQEKQDNGIVSCFVAASGGSYYRDHLAVLDCELMASCNSDCERDPDEDSLTDAGAAAAGGGQTIMAEHSNTDSFAKMLKQAARHAAAAAAAATEDMREGNAMFQKGDRVQVNLDPDDFKNLQQENGCGGWNDKMALCIGLTGKVKGVLHNDTVMVKYKNFERAWAVNPAALSKQQFFIGDAVQILPDEVSIRNLQKGHGGWVHRMKDIVGKVGEVVHVDSDRILKVKVDKLEWMLNAACCKLVDSDLKKDKKKAYSDGDDVMSFMSHLMHADSDDNLHSLKAMMRQKKSTTESALHKASRDGNIELVKSLLESDADVVATDEALNTPIHCATFKDHADVLELLLVKCNNVDVVNYKRRTALHTAVYEHSVNCVEVLIRHSADINAQDADGNTPLHTAIRVSCHAAVDLIVSQPNFNFKATDRRGSTVLHTAAYSGDIHAVERVLAYAPSDIVDMNSVEGDTALHLACYQGFLPVAEILITQGKANLESRDLNLRTPLLTALSRARVSLVEFMVSHGANVNAADSDGDTALHWIMLTLAGESDGSRAFEDISDAFETVMICSELLSNIPNRQFVALACYFVKHGADLQLANHRGRTPLDLVDNNNIFDALLSRRPQ